MNRSIEQALYSLIPSHSTTLPKPLTDLASSLLAQSRHRASTLKAEEEISRPYACAHIACDRLKITLNLPPIEPRPPIPPRIYKRLYNHLDHILPAAASTPGGRIRTPSAKLRDAIAGSPLANKSRPTPTQGKSLSQYRNTPLGTTPSKRARRDDTDPIPVWVRPVVRFVCKELDQARIGPVVMAGVESVVAPQGKRVEDEWVNGNFSAMLGTLILFVWKGVAFNGVDMDAAKMGKLRGKVVRLLQKAREEAEVGGWEGWEDVKARELDAAVLHAKRQGWLEMNWVEGIEDLVAVGEKGGESEEEAGGEDEKVLGQVRRADTMLQERYDYLSEMRREEYQVWKEGIMKRIKVLEKAPAKGNRKDEDAMDVDED
ncbi:hypothetical protein OQA88_4997 [Cercophora sp. LCS_1]